MSSASGQAEGASGQAASMQEVAAPLPPVSLAPSGATTAQAAGAGVPGNTDGPAEQTSLTQAVAAAAAAAQPAPMTK
eukprot:COSAG03_NODE_16155_length_410_cov_0.926045_1_plen_76_part_01